MISYEAPGPVAAAAALARLNRQRGPLGGAAGGGHGYGEAPYDTGIQDAINARDKMQFAQQQQVDENSFRGALPGFQAQAALNQDANRFGLQAQLHDVELSQSERMRLQRLKNSIGEVSSDPNLTEAEKADFVTQLKTGIDPLQRRLTQEKLQQETIVKKSLVDKYELDAALHKRQLDALSKTVPDRTPFVPDPTSLSQIASDIERNADLPPMTPQQRDQVISKMAQEEAMRQGLGTHAYLQPDGKLVPFDRHTGGLGHEGEHPGSSGAAPGGRGVPNNHPTGLSAKEYADQYHQVVESVDKKLAMRDKDTLQPTYPQTAEWRARAIESEFAARMEAMRKYTEAKPPVPGAGGYDPKKTAWYKPPQAPVAAAATSGPIDFAKPATPEHKVIVANFDKSMDEVKNSSGSADERQAAFSALGEMKTLLTNKGSYQAMDADERRRFDEAKNTVAGVVKGGPRKIIPELPSSYAGPTSRPWWSIVASGAGGGGGTGGGYGGQK